MLLLHNYACNNQQNEELRRIAVNRKLILSFTNNKLCRNNEQLLLWLPTKLGRMGIPVFFRNHGRRMSKLNTTNRRMHNINSATRKNIQDLKINYKQHQEEDQMGKKGVWSTKTCQYKIKTDLLAMLAERHQHWARCFSMAKHSTDWRRS